MSAHSKLSISKRICLAGLLAFGAAVPARGKLPDYNAFAATAKAAGSAYRIPAAASGLVDTDHPTHIEKILNVPTFVWTTRQTLPKAALARSSGTAASGEAPTEFAAQNYVRRYAGLYRLNEQGLASARVHHVHDLGRGGVIVKLKQEVGGIEVFQREMNVLMNQDLELLALSGYLSPHASSARAGQAGFQLDFTDAVAAAFEDLHGEILSTADLEYTGQADEYRRYALQSGVRVAHALRQPVRIKRVLYQLAEGLEAAYFLELSTQSDNGAGRENDEYAYVVSARDGRLLFRKNLVVNETAQPFTYRVWADESGPHLPYDSPRGNDATPHPTGIPGKYRPPLRARNHITLACGPIRTCDPWLPADATASRGNNVNAYADLNEPDGFDGKDPRAETNSDHVFDPAYEPSLSPQANADQIGMAIVQAFYTANFLHDWLYDHGFDEAAGNGQRSNYGRGGKQGDPMKVEIQDYSDLNNADMATPPDGASPVMQLFLWDGGGVRSLRIDDPAELAGTHTVGIANFGPAKFRVQGKVVLVDDGVDATSNGCEAPFINGAALAGNIALIDRGICLFVEKVKNAQDAGAIGVIIANHLPDGVANMVGGDDNALTASIVIPALMVARNDGDAMKEVLAEGEAVQATLSREDNVPVDAALDNTVVAHEWAHFLSARLIGDAVGLDNQQGLSMGEGWSDFLALLMIVREQDARVPANAGYGGAYAVGSYAILGTEPRAYYFGIRRYPYSTDPAKNPLTFKHIKDGIRLPKGIPVASVGKDGIPNSEVHKSGEVWASMLWEAYAALLNDRARLGFREAQERMLDYLVASLKLTPVSPTFTEARDALLAVAEARDPEDYRLFWRAFAKRGAGLDAVAPDRHSRRHQGVVEDFTAP